MSGAATALAVVAFAAGGWLALMADAATGRALATTLFVAGGLWLGLSAHAALARMDGAGLRRNDNGGGA